MARLIELIETEELIGAGKSDDPFRRVTQLWSKEGVLIAAYDPHEERSQFNPAGVDRWPVLRAADTDAPAYGIAGVPSQY